MGRLNRAMRRKAERIAIKDKLNIDDIREESANALVANRTQKTTHLLTTAFILSDWFDYGKKQSKTTRVKTTLDSVHNYILKLLNDTLTKEERAFLDDIDSVFKAEEKKYAAYNNQRN